MDAAVIISAIGAVIIGVLGLHFKYNQKSKDKLTDLKIEKFKQDEEARMNGETIVQLPYTANYGVPFIC